MNGPAACIFLSLLLVISVHSFTGVSLHPAAGVRLTARFGSEGYPKNETPRSCPIFISLDYDTVDEASRARNNHALLTYIYKILRLTHSQPKYTFPEVPTVAVCPNEGTWNNDRQLHVTFQTL